MRKIEQSLNGQQVEVLTEGNDREGWSVTIYALGDPIPVGHYTGSSRTSAREAAGLEIA